MSPLKALALRAIAAAAFIAFPVATMAASTGNLQVQNNEPGTINLSSQSPGACGTWISPIAPGAPPPSVAGSSTSGAFQLVVSTCPAAINVAYATYTFAQGDLLSQCTYTITGNGPFTYKATGVDGCKILFTPLGSILFVFPDTVGLHVRGHSTTR